MKNRFFNEEITKKAAILFMTTILLLSIFPAIAQSSEQIYNENQITKDQQITNNYIGSRGEEAIYY